MAPIDLIDPIGVRETAQAIGISPGRFARVWRDLMTTEDFPPPIREAGTLYWHPLAIEAWRLRGTPDQVRELIQGYFDHVLAGGAAIGQEKDWETILNNRLEDKNAA